MKECYIRLDHVDMYYPSNIYNATTLKQELFARLRLEPKKGLLRDVHALRDFTFHVNRGERVGVIGRNGSGKSTLLKTIAGVYPAKNGTVEVAGKIRALFEISLGFDFESTGRENVLYRGLLLGATPNEINDKIDSIIEFADIGEFIDYPIKSYSTGMLVRLAFAVSTSLSGEILLLDEVVSAGDINFQDKARRRIYDLMDDAQMMVFVSHDLNTIKEVCNRVILMRDGKIVEDGKPEKVIESYLASMTE